MSKNVDDLRQAMHDVQKEYEAIKEGIGLIVHFNLPQTGKVMKNQRQSEHDLKQLKKKVHDFKEAAKELDDVLGHLL